MPLLLVCGFVAPKLQKKRSYFQILFFFSDVFTIVAVVYIINFLSTGKCDMSTYHYYVALDSVLVACSTILVTFTISGKLYWKTWACILRLMSAISIFALLGVLLGYQLVTHGDKDFPNYWPSTGSDTALLLPASCFFDPDLIRYSNPYSPMRMRNRPFSEAQMAIIGNPTKSKKIPEMGLYWTLAVLFLVALIISFAKCCHCGNYSRRAKRAGFQKKSKIAMKCFSALILAFCLSVDIYCAVHVSRLRAWAKASGWLKNNSENELSSLGQLMPIGTLAGISFLILDQLKRRKKADSSAQHVSVDMEQYDKIESTSQVGV
jgi:hypothetical protein